MIAMSKKKQNLVSTQVDAKVCNCLQKMITEKYGHLRYVFKHC